MTHHTNPQCVCDAPIHNKAPSFLYHENDGRPITRASWSFDRSTYPTLLLRARRDGERENHREDSTRHHSRPRVTSRRGTGVLDARHATTRSVPREKLG